LSAWSFAEAQAFLENMAPPGTSVYGLGRIAHLLDLLDHPERSFACVTIVGTNGKGSVLAFLDSLLRAHGIRVVCHVKPHLESVTERIRIHGEDSTPEEFASALWRVHDAVDKGWTREDRPTYFELIFAAALCAAQNANAQVALLEAGLGGRLDAVNGVDADMVVLTSVGLDHTELLGETLRAIVSEKLAVVRPGSILVCQQNPAEVIDTVQDYCAANGVCLVEVATNEKLSWNDAGMFDYRSARLGIIKDLRAGIKGDYQLINIPLALIALEVFSEDVQPELFPSGLMEETIRNGLASARLPGRWEELRLSSESPVVILDGAHNRDALGMVLAQFRRSASGPRTVIFGSKVTKMVDEILPELLDSADRIILVSVPDVVSHPPEELAQTLRSALKKKNTFSQVEINCADSIMEALTGALAQAAGAGTILVTGSLYLVGAVRSALRQPEALLLFAQESG